ncbi:exocyst complex component Sec5-domain-containing protein [Crepidotus variabilis]|uniref:Exocyst complex component SEC5 n=1 Tax=Crepidotus variabilis TaxID=179855 RepID=A0A9P6JLP6_9AGAR|nr:exocyst complex component Sec5-domain-containing protein [Crepidotus variabilis]
MPRLNFEVDEDTILKAYKLGSLVPTQWEEVDYDNMVDLVHLENVRDREKEGGDPLGLPVSEDIDIKDMDMETKSQILISSKNFSPSTYLALMHPHATYADLLHGISYLESSLAERSEALRILVEDQFDRFVSVKTVTDGLYEDMKIGILAPERDHGSLPVRVDLKGGLQKANQIFLPVLENASKAHKLSTTLSVFERSKFFFNLPSFIIESIDAGRYDLALRDYKKGKYLLENRPSQLLPIASSNNSNTSHNQPIPAAVLASQQTQQKRILQKVWLSVEKAMAELKSVLVKQLVDPRRSVDEIEKSLETLLEFQGNDEPLWTYFDHQHKFIMEQMNTAYERGVKAIEASLRDVEETILVVGTLEFVLERELKTSMLRLEAKQADVVLATSMTEPAWQALLDQIKNLSEAISGSGALTSFWTIAKGFIQGKYKKHSTTASTSASRRSPSQCRTMAIEVIQLYISLISQIFILSDISLMSSPSASTSMTSFQQQQTGSQYTNSMTHSLPLIPISSPSFCTAYYVQKILAEVGECVSDLLGLDLAPSSVPLPGGGGSGISQGLKSLLESLKWRMTDILTRDWLRDAGMFYTLESWIVSRIEPSSTIYLSRFELFQRHMTTAAYKIVSGSSDVPSTTNGQPSSKSKTSQIPTVFTGKITRAFVDALYAFLDGLVLLASEESPIVRDLEEAGKANTTGILGPTKREYSNIHSREGSPLGVVEMRLHDQLDLRDGNVRLLLVISNLKYLSNTIIPGMITQLEGAFGLLLTDDRTTLGTVVEELDKTLFNEYVNPRAATIVKMVQAGYSVAHIDWQKASLPTGVRPYVSAIMNYVVDVHSQVCDVSSTLLERTMNALLDELVNDAIKGFGQIQRFGTGGLLVAVMELTFIHKSLGYYGRDTNAGKNLEDLYMQKITAAYSPSSKEPEFKTSFDSMQKALSDARRASAVHFLCFRQNSTSSSRSGTESGKTNGKANGDTLDANGRDKARDKSDKDSIISTTSHRKAKEGTGRTTRG